MIDSHCHLDHEPLFSDLSNIIKRSKDVGIEKLLTISTSFDSFSKIKEIVKQDEIIYGTIGIHPHESEKDIIKLDEIIKNFQENDKIIGIRSCGCRVSIHFDYAKCFSRNRIYYFILSSFY